METTQTSTIASKDSRSAWRKTDTMWMLGLYGTAIGAGVLFLPINAGVGGMIPLIIMAILAFPMTFFAHRVLSLTPADLAAAKEQNISILSYLANHFNAPVIAWMAPIIAIIAITKSFLGHYLGAREGFNGMVIKSLRGKGKSIEINKLNRITALFMLVTTWIVATLNPSILGMIETLGGPIIAMILFLMPMYAIQKVPAMRKYSGHISNVFVVVMGLIAISAIFYSLFS